jgi:hypothetical protein
MELHEVTHARKILAGGGTNSTQLWKEDAI